MEKQLDQVTGLAIFGREGDEYLRDYRNWQSYEIEKNYEAKNKLIVVVLDPSYTVPNACFMKGAKFIYGYSLDSIKSALDGFIV